ncbi:MAG TPA: acetolactate synthase small subunit [Candidatus Limnocylindrales bacterium]|nr:acetolactate synthase small subunit [Candidatus Limnocylindrales bacterium]
MTESAKHTISILVENEFGVLSRVAGMFSGRGYNIESLSVAETLDESVSRITLTVRGSASVLEQIIKQLNKLVAVIRVVDFREGEYVERELALIKVAFDSAARAEVMNIVSIFRASVVDVGTNVCIIETTGAEAKIEAMIRLLAPLGIKEIARTGSAALYRGERLLTVAEENNAAGETAVKENVA